MNGSGTSGQKPPRGLDTSVSHSARVWNYWLGGKDNYPVDHEAGDQFAAILPSIVDVARASRAFLVRAVRYLAGHRASAGQEAPAVGGNHRGSPVHRNSVRLCYRASRSPGW
jgi:hypothetical protein